MLTLPSLPTPPSYIELNIKALEHNAPEPRFKVVKVTPEMIAQLYVVTPSSVPRRLRPKTPHCFNISSLPCPGLQGPRHA